MSSLTKKGNGATIRGQARFFELVHANLSGLALRCALKLNIAEIINNHNGPVTLSQIAQGIDSPSVNVDGLYRLMMFLVYHQIFDEVQQPESEEPQYALNECSKFLVKDASNTLAPVANAFLDQVTLAPFYNLNESIKEGGTAAFKTYGVELYDFFSRNPQHSRNFYESLACYTRINMEAMMSSYDIGSLEGTLVDVGGGVGAAISEIVTRYPHLKGINFDLPHVVSSAPTYEGVTHVGGDIFTAIPLADSFLVKAILHNWSDDKCIQILKNCQQSMTKRNGKVIIVDIVLNRRGDDVFDGMRLNMDMMMLACFDGGKERTEVDWKRLLEKAGFPYYKVIKVPAIMSIIEAYME